MNLSFFSKRSIVLVPLDESLSQYEGFFTVGGEDYNCKILKGKKGHYELLLSSKFVSLIPSNVVGRELGESQSLDDLVDGLERIIAKASRFLEERGKVSTTLSNKTGNRFFERLLDELDDVGWNRVVHLSPDCSRLTLKILNKHHLVFRFDTDLYPTKKPHLETPQLPATFQWNWIPETTTVRDIVSAYEKETKKYEEFWKLMQEIDSKTCVVEPRPADLCHVTRRIRLPERNCSVRIEVNPLTPRQVPTLKFLGADEITENLKKMFYSRQHLWDPRGDLLPNLSLLLNVKFPTRDEVREQVSHVVGSQGGEDVDEFCGICYVVEANGQIPEHVCDNLKCLKPFHTECLKKWLQVNQDVGGRKGTVLTGKCPYCDEKISMNLEGT